MAGGWWFLANWTLGAGVVVGFLLWLLLLGLVAMASSAYVKWRVVAGAISLAFFFILAGVAEMIDDVFRVTWGHVLDPAWAVNRVWCALLGVDPLEGPGAGASLLALAGVHAPARPGDRTQAAAGGGGPMTELAAPKLGRLGERRRAARLRRGLEVLRRSARRQPRHAEHPAGHHQPGRAERLRQDDADEPDDRPDLPRPRPHPHARHLAARSRSADAHHRLRHAVRHRAALGHGVHLHHHRPAALRLRTIGSGETGLEGARARAPDRRREPQGRGVFQGHAPARAAGAGHRARSRRAGARRAAERPRPAGPRRDDRPVPLAGRRRASTSSSRATCSRRWT